MKNTPSAIAKKPDSLPLVALIGPTNAGKSTLFNRLTGSWQAITAREESTTRDRIYGEVIWQGRRFDVIDTGGLAEDDSDLYKRILSQTLEAVNEADVIVFVYDGLVGMTPRDKQFVSKLRATKPVYLVANKMDSLKRHNETESLDYLGLPFFKLSGASGKGVGDLLEDLSKSLPRVEVDKSTEPIIALVGRPNVGKSTLLNTITKSDRAVVSPVAGTTRDIVTSQITIDGRDYLLADTAGVRRRGRIDRGPEDFSVKRTLAAISSARAVIILVDATEGTTRGDLHLIYFAHQINKPLLIVINKIDLVRDKNVPYYKYLSKFPHEVISALNGENVEKILDWIRDNVS